MNPPTHSEARSWTPDRWSRLAWLPIPLLLAAIIAARMAGLRDSYESQTLLLILSFTFYTLVSLGTLYLIGRSFLGLGSPGLLLLECGVILWSLAGTIGDFASQGDANINVTIFNTGILLAGLCHLAGTILALKPPRVLRARPLWLVACFALALGALWLVSQAALMGWLPVFFIPGQGGTPVRHLVLISAIAMFVLSSGLLRVSQRMPHLPFTSWYALALLMLAVGLFGVMIQLSLGSVVNWLSRTAQWLGGTYLLFAAFASLRESQLPLLPPVKQSGPAYYRDAVAVAVVLAAAAMRLTFLSALGTQAPFVTFFPAVMLASIYGGLRAGLVATALSTILVDYFWIGPMGFAIGQPADWLAMMIFLLSGAMIAGVSGAMHRARVRASEAEKQALLAAERAAAAEALQEGRAKLEAALASMTDAVFISDTEGRFIDFNDAFATFHRFRNKDECSKTFAEYPDILDVFMADGTLAPLDQWAVPRALRGETATNAEYTLRRKDTGDTWNGSYSFGPVLNKEGGIVGSVVTARDITERKRAEEAMRLAYSRLQTFFDHRIGGIGIVIATAEGDVRQANDYYLDLLGCTRDELLAGKVKWRTFTPPEWLAEDERALAQLRKHGVCEATEKEYVRRDGSRVPVHIAAAMLPGEETEILAFVLDLTQRKQAEVKLRRYELLADRHRDVILFIELDGGRILDANQAATRTYGYSHGQLQNLTIHDLRAADKQGLNAAQKAIAFDQGLLFEMIHRRQDGMTFPVEVSAQGAEIDGRRILISVVRDITERKRIENELAAKTAEIEARTRQLEAANRELESFSYSVSHDLRAPLRAIDGYSQMILKKTGGQFDEETRRRFQVIRDNAAGMGQLIDDLLAFSRLGRQQVTKVSLDMEELIRDAWQELVTINPDRAMTLKMEPMPAAFGDQALIRQVYSNLLGNAVKFTRGRNPAVIEAGCCVQKGEAVYYIRDNGVGFDMKFYDKLFGVFQRLHSDEEYKGTGIGLALVQRVIERHGGRVWAESEEGRGATFYFTLPTRQG